MFRQTTATNKILGMKRRIRAVPGGTSASKSISILLYLVARAQSDRKPTLTSIVSESLPHLKRGVMRDFLAILKEHNYYRDANWNRTNFTYTFETGSTIEFFSADQPDKLRGARRDRLFINEANNVHFEAFQQLEVRTKEFVFLDWNPTTEFWYYTDVKGTRDDVEELTLTYLDNEALDPEIVRSIEQRRGNKAWWQVYGLGQLGEVESRIYTGWQVVDGIPHEARLETYGHDHGYSADPAAGVAIWYFNGGYILDQVLYQKGMSNKNVADVYAGLPKAPIYADSAEPKSNDEIASYGLAVLPAQKGPDSVDYGIKFVQGLKISVTKRSVDLLKEYRNYTWETDREGRLTTVPSPYNNHLMDAVRYGFTPMVARQEVTDEDRARFLRNRLANRSNKSR